MINYKPLTKASKHLEVFFYNPLTLGAVYYYFKCHHRIQLLIQYQNTFTAKLLNSKAYKCSLFSVQIMAVSLEVNYFYHNHQMLKLFQIHRWL